MLRVNSFPRTANMFTHNMLLKFFDVKSIEYNAKIMHSLDMLNDKTMAQIVIIRNPKDCIPSFQITKSLGEKPDNGSILNSMNLWIEWHEEVIKNLYDLFLFSFEEITNNPADCLIAVADINKITHRTKEEMKNYSLHSAYGDNLLEQTTLKSSKNSNEYENKVNEYYDQDFKILKKLDDLYLKLKRAVEINQQYHGIKIKEMEI